MNTPIAFLRTKKLTLFVCEIAFLDQESNSIQGMKVG